MHLSETLKLMNTDNQLLEAPTPPQSPPLPPSQFDLYLCFSQLQHRHFEDPFENINFVVVPVWKLFMWLILVVGYHRPVWTFTVSICWGWWHQKVFKTICFSRNWCCFFKIIFDFKEIVGHISEEACHISHLGLALDDISQNGSSATWRQQERTRLKPNLCKVAPIHTIAHHFFFWEIIWFYFLKMFIFLLCQCLQILN